MNIPWLTVPLLITLRTNRRLLIINRHKPHVYYVRCVIWRLTRLTKQKIVRNLTIIHIKLRMHEWPVICVSLRLRSTFTVRVVVVHSVNINILSYNVANIFAIRLTVQIFTARHKEVLVNSIFTNIFIFTSMLATLIFNKPICNMYFTSVFHIYRSIVRE